MFHRDILRFQNFALKEVMLVRLQWKLEWYGPEYMALIVKFMFYNKGRWWNDYNIDMNCVEKSFEEAVNDEWLVEFMECVDLYLNAEYMDILILRRVCVLKIMSKLKDKSKRDAMKWLNGYGITNNYYCRRKIEEWFDKLKISNPKIIFIPFL